MPETIIVHIENDQEAEDPQNYDGWRLYCFSTRFTMYKDPEELGLSLQQDLHTGQPIVKSPGLRQKLKNSLAFFVSYFEHGDGRWYLQGEPDPPDMRWDGVRWAGLLIWEGKAKDLPKENRESSAKRFLEIFTDYCNGHVYEWGIQRGDIDIEWMGSWYDSDLKQMFDDMREHTAGKYVTVTGEADWLAKYHDVGGLIRETEDVGS